MQKLKEYKYIISITLLVLSFAFYWYELRSLRIERECIDFVLKNQKVNNLSVESAAFGLEACKASGGKERFLQTWQSVSIPEKPNTSVSPYWPGLR